jgi:hypothetical protein
MGMIHEVHNWDGFRWHDIHTKFHEDWFRHSSNIKVITSTIQKAVALVLLRRRIYDECCWEDLRWQNTYMPSLMMIGLGNSSNIKHITWTIWDVIALLLIGRGISDVSHWDGLRQHDIYIPSFMKICTDIQTILRFCLNNSNGCNIGISDGRHICNALLGWAHAITWYLYKFSGRLVQEFKHYEGFPSAIWMIVMLVLLMERIYVMHRWYGVRCHDIHSKFHKDCFMHSKVVGGGHSNIIP